MRRAGLRNAGLAAAAALLALAGRALSADQWDGLDEGAGTANQLTHGSEQVHDLAARPGPAPDEDWFRVGVPARSSFEVLVDGAAADLGSDQPQFLSLVHSDGSLVEESLPLLPGKGARSVTYENATSDDYVGKFARVRSQGCGSACGREAVYVIRGYDTTLSAARFNDSGSQLTLLVLQNAGGPELWPAVSGHAWFWDESGALLAAWPFSLGRWQSVSLNTASLPGLPGARGSISVSHDGRYGQLTGKAVSVEPATGFSFDTPLQPRPR